MLGIFLIICMAVYLIIKLKIYNLFINESNQQVKLESTPRTYHICSKAVKLHSTSLIFILVGAIGCVWPYLLIEEDGASTFWDALISIILAPAIVAYACYSNFKSIDGFFKINVDEIEYKIRKSITIKVSDIKKIIILNTSNYKIYFTEKHKKPIYFNLSSFDKKKEICLLIKQLQNHSNEIFARDTTLTRKAKPWRPEIIFGKYFAILSDIILIVTLLYCSYCCIDYDFFKKDYTALYNSLYADPNQTENAWPYYVNAAVNYVDMDSNLQDYIDENIKNDKLELPDEQTEKLIRWYHKKRNFMGKSKKATSIDYCNATFKSISLHGNPDKNNFSNANDTGYKQLRNLYVNIDKCRLTNILDLDWFELFQMKLSSSKHFINGKSCLDQLVGYGMLAASTRLLAEQKNYTPQILQNTRNLLNEYYPKGIPPLKIEGEIYISCSCYDSMINAIKTPVQTPLNKMFLFYGSMSGTEKYVRKLNSNALEKAKKGIEVEPQEFSILNFPVLRHMIFDIHSANVSSIYKITQRTVAELSAAYVILDLEEYKLTKGNYPADIEQLQKAGFTSRLPTDPDSGSSIIYRNDGQTAILYAVGSNAIDDGGFRDDKDSSCDRDDIIYWQRNLADQTLQ